VTRIYFPNSEVYGASDHDKPSTNVRLFSRAGGLPLTAPALLDTGSETTVLSTIWAPQIGIADVTVGSQGVERFIEASKPPTDPGDPGYIHLVEVEWLGIRRSIPVAFVPAWSDEMENLLGMRGFFAGLIVAFNHDDRLVYATQTT
jgi:hypothetical protein